LLNPDLTKSLVQMAVFDEPFQHASNLILVPRQLQTLLQQKLGLNLLVEIRDLINLALVEGESTDQRETCHKGHCGDLVCLF